jgi:YbgC/YbaW family acyl-CoA thioester hydrolase
MEEFFAARSGVSYQKLLADERMGFATVKIEAEYFVPLVYGDTAEVELVISELGRSSARFNYTLKRSNDSVLCAQSTQIQVAMDIDKRRAIPPPEKYRVAFST